MAYNAIVTRITNVDSHPNADRLKVSLISGYNVIVGLDTKVGDKVVLFPPDGQLSEEYAEKNNLVGYVDEKGEKKGGFFEKSRRVKVAKLRGIRSEAYVALLDSFSYTGFDFNSVECGYEFTELNGFKICDKYYTPATQKAMRNNANKPKQRKENVYFRKHIDTSQYRTSKFGIKPGALVIISEKLHGTSARGGKVLDTVYSPLNIFQRTYNFVFGKFFGYIKQKEHQEFKNLLGTRNVILNPENSKKGFYAQAGESETFREKAFNSFKDLLHSGEIIYSELVGYVSENTSIMPSVPTSKANDKELVKMYGKEMKYAYCCVPGQSEQYVYRITQTSDDGTAFELPYFQMTRRLKELGLKTPPLMTDPFIFDGDFEKLDKMVEGFVEGPDVLDKSHIREGVVIRAENPDGTTVFLKSKSFTFLLLEGIVKNDENYVDTEEVS
ncbi:hypothetical protein M0P65_05265 [Candidatus Gracilibacteria bacterium]|nr:hypothetical protein [Candidatus Gracilibacteria bacterium]